MAILAGVMLALNSVPVLYMQDNSERFENAPKDDGLPYVFSHFFGGYIASTLGFLFYAVFK